MANVRILSIPANVIIILIDLKKCRFYSLMTTSWAVGVEVKLVPSVRRMYAR
jgi:hypothetical protein